MNEPKTLKKVFKKDSPQNIEVYDLEALDAPNLISFIKASTVQKKIRQLLKEDPEGVDRFLSMVILEACAAINPKDELNQVQKKDIERTLKKTFAGLSITEIAFAMREGRSGALGLINHYGKVDAEYFVKVLTAYVEKKKEIKISHNINDAVTKPAIDFTPDDKRRMVERGLNEEFEHFKNTGTFTDSSRAWIFEWLTEKKLINPSPEERAALYLKVKKTMLENPAKYATGPVKKFRLMLEEPKNPRIIKNCKYHYIKIAFEKMLENDKEIRYYF